MEDRCHLYFHAACFDGAASAAIAWDYLASKGHSDEPELHPVDYGIKATWLSTKLPKRSAVVDFAYHPGASFWADHHVTAFLEPAARRSYAQRRLRHELLYDPAAPSCARVLIEGTPGENQVRASRFRDLVAWADKIDAARYDSVAEAIEGSSPAQRISAALANDPSRDIARLVVRGLRDRSMEEVASMELVAMAGNKVRSLEANGLSRLEHAATLDGGDIVVFDIDASGVLLNRYAPFYLFPAARYSVGVTRTPESVKLTAMRNPWIEFESAPIGAICSALGGGGHIRVGSILFSKRRARYAGAAVRRVLEQIRRLDHAPRTLVQS